MIWLILTVGAANVCLGYMLAAYMGYAPPTVGAAWKSLSADPFHFDRLGLSAEKLAEQLRGMSIDQLLDDQPDDTLTDGLAVEAYDESEDDETSGLLHPDQPEMWDLNEKFVETSILKLNIAMMKSGARATEIDTRLRECRGRTDAQTIQSCLAQLREDCESYLAEQTELAERFRQRIGELGELSHLGEEIEMANLEQSAQVETTLNNLKNMDFASELEEAGARLITEIKNLRIARHKLRDQQEVAFLAVARYEGRLDKIESRLYTDPQTKLRNRIGIETTLHQWWQQGRQKAREINAALFDLDQFGRLNDTHGPLAGDRILYHFAKLIQEHVGKADLVGRYAGDEFLVVFFDVGPRTAIKTAETIRQTLQKTTFLHGEEEVVVTACGGFTEVKAEDTEETAFARLGEALKQAKKAGLNTAFVHDGRSAEPVESPNLGAQPREIRI